MFERVFHNGRARALGITVLAVGIITVPQSVYWNFFKPSCKRPPESFPRTSPRRKFVSAGCKSISLT